MGRVFVLGAGFAKAVADLPLTKEMIPRIQALISEDMRSGDPSLLEGASYVHDFLIRSHERYLLQPFLQRGVRQVVSSNFFEDVEFLLTMLDLNSAWDREAVIVDHDGVQQSWSLGRIDVAPDHLAPLFIEDYVYRVLWRESGIDEQVSRFVSKTKPGDTIITFNYDLLLDRAMYQAGIWHPSSGYGISPSVPNTEWLDKPRDSQVTILKLHGSLNWDVPRDTLSWDAARDTLILHAMHDPATPYLPGCAVSRDPLNIRRPPRRDFGILPSLLKCIDSRPLLEIWAQAHAALRMASDAIVIGYSLPEVDGPAWTLFATSMNVGQTLKVFARGDAEAVARRFRTATGCQVTCSEGGLKAYLSS